jgi:hypothetical protein
MRRGRDCGSVYASSCRGWRSGRDHASPDQPATGGTVLTGEGQRLVRELVVDLASALSSSRECFEWIAAAAQLPTSSRSLRTSVRENGNVSNTP